MLTQPNHPYPVLIVDDEPQALESFTMAIELLGINNILTCRDETLVMGLLDKEDVEIILLDLVMPRVSGEKLLEEIVLQYPDIPVIMITGVDDIPTAVRCIRKGAFDYLTKPVDTDQFASAINRALEHRLLKRKNELLLHHLFTDSLKFPEAFSDIVTRDKTMMNLFMYCEAIAPGKEPVLITGETGVGKELFARAIHLASGRGGEFIAVNVAGVDDHAFSDTLFGHKRGAFTGAAESRRGLIDKASGGTIFLDEIGDLVESAQIKLLRVLQDREYFPLGSDQSRPADARVVVATNREIRELVSSGRMRQDLHYRLRTHHVHVPPLRKRMQDIPLLLDHYIEEAAREFGKARPTYPPELLQLLMVHNFPGNVRELRAMVYDAVSKHSSRVMSMETFRERIHEDDIPAPAPPSAEEGIYSRLEKLPTLRDAADALVREAMHRAGHNQRLASRVLGISPSALNKRLSTLE